MIVQPSISSNSDFVDGFRSFSFCHFICLKKLMLYRASTSGTLIDFIDSIRLEVFYFNGCYIGQGQGVLPKSIKILKKLYFIPSSKFPEIGCIYILETLEELVTFCPKPRNGIKSNTSFDFTSCSTLRCL